MTNEEKKANKKRKEALEQYKVDKIAELLNRIDRANDSLEKITLSNKENTAERIKGLKEEIEAVNKLVVIPEESVFSTLDSVYCGGITGTIGNININ